MYGESRRMFFKYWDRCYDFENIFAKKLRKMAFFLILQLVFAKKIIVTLVFDKNAICFAEKWQK
jgi:hypothetical protein